MNACLLNRESYSLPSDGWYQLAPLGEFPHGESGVVQVVDTTACEAMAVDFREKSQGENFAGVLIDFDHFSLDAGSRSEAAGWITALEARGGQSGNAKLESGKNPEGGGLWAQIRWSDLGEAAVSGGRYRFLSPVWARSDCEDLGDNRIRPVRLLNAAVTNDPNLKGMVPLSNRRGASDAGIKDKGEGIKGLEERRTLNAERRTSNFEREFLKNAEGEKRLKWVLGDSPDDRHCPSCERLAGQVHTEAEWEAAGIAPKGSGLYCQGHCHCSLVETDEPSSGSLAGTPLREEEEMSNSVGQIRANRGGVLEDLMMKHKELENIGWTDEARAASLAVRRAKAARRDGSGDSGSDDNSDSDDSSDLEESSGEPSIDDIRDKLENGEPLTREELDHVDALMEDGYAGESDSDPVFEFMERWSMMDRESREQMREEAKSGNPPPNPNDGESEEGESEKKEPGSHGAPDPRDDGEEDLIRRLEEGSWMSEEDRATAEELKRLRDGDRRHGNRALSPAEAVWEDKWSLRNSRNG